MGGAQGQQVESALNAIRQAQRANVSIYTINPRGLEVFADEAARGAINVANDALTPSRTRPAASPSRVRTASPRRSRQIFRETGSYYLLGFQSAYTDGKFRRINVR